LQDRLEKEVRVYAVVA